jgi:hypothetical protein
VEALKVRVPGRDIAIACALVLLAFTLVADVRVPVLAYVDLGIHELGHMLTFWMPPLLTAMAGSILQVMVPVGLALYFWGTQHDRPAAGLLFGWAATSAYDAARYIADAPYERLPLLGGDHDWAFVLFEVDQMERASAYATTAQLVAWGMLLGGVALLASRYVREWRRTG